MVVGRSFRTPCLLLRVLPVKDEAISDHIADRFVANTRRNDTSNQNQRGFGYKNFDNWGKVF